MTLGTIKVSQMPECVTLSQREHGTAEERSKGFTVIDGDLFSAVQQMHKNYLDDIEAAI